MQRQVQWIILYGYFVIKSMICTKAGWSRNAWIKLTRQKNSSSDYWKQDEIEHDYRPPKNTTKAIPFNDQAMVGVSSWIFRKVEKNTNSYIKSKQSWEKVTFWRYNIINRLKEKNVRNPIRFRKNEQSIEKKQTKLSIDLEEKGRGERTLKFYFLEKIIFFSVSKRKLEAGDLNLDYFQKIIPTFQTSFLILCWFLSLWSFSSSFIST